MPRKIIVTRDGSPSIEWQVGVTYHSTFGALQESRHIFIDRGWKTLTTGRSVSDGLVPNEPVRVFELGLGAGLNALLTLSEAETMQLPVYYDVVDAYPLEAAIFEALDYCAQLGRPDLQPKFLQLHMCHWETPISISPYFTFCKSRDKWPDHELRQAAGFQVEKLPGPPGKKEVVRAVLVG